VISKQEMYVTEGGANDTYTVVLTSRPVDLVTIFTQQNHQVLSRPSSLVFSSTNWNVKQVIQTVAVDDVQSENLYGGSHFSHAISHHASSTDFKYNTRMPHCYYVNRNGTKLVCDSDLNTPESLNFDRCSNVAHGNGNCFHVILPNGSQSSPVDNIPPRFAFSHPNPNPGTSYIKEYGHGSVSSEILNGSSFFEPHPQDGGWGYVNAPHMHPHILLQPNPNPLPSGIISSFPNLSQIPADVFSAILAFFGQNSVEGIQKLKMAGASSNISKTLSLNYAVCRGIQRLSQHRWSFEEWTPGMAEKVLRGILILFPNLHAFHLHGCGNAQFTVDSTIYVHIADNDPGVTISKLMLSVTEGQASDTYSLVLNSPPAFSTGTIRPAWKSFTPMCSQELSSICSYQRAALEVYERQCTNVSQGSPCTVKTTFPKSMAHARDGNPAGPAVTIAIYGNAELSITPAFVTFTASNWYTPQAVIVGAVDDSYAEQSQNHTIGHLSMSSDPMYNGKGTVFWAGQSPNSNPANFWNGSSDPSFNPYPDYDYDPLHSRLLVTIHDNDMEAVIISQTHIDTSEAQRMQSHTGEAFHLRPFRAFSINSKSKKYIE
jgi:hypothetical protein